MPPVWLLDTAAIIFKSSGDPEQVRKLFQDVGRAHGRIDVLFLNAGIAKFASLADSSAELVDQILQVNLKGPFLALRAALPLLGKGASVIFNASVAGERALTNTSIYSASKAALAALARGAAVELAPKGVRVNTVSPGPNTTPIFGKLGLPPEAQDDFAKRVATSVPLGRFGAADEVARAALFLASDDATFVAGHVLMRPDDFW